MKWRTAESRPTAPVSAAMLARPAGAVTDSMTVAACTLISRITGFGRVAATAAVLGPTYFGNTYQATNNLPNIIFYGLLAGSLVSSLLVPAMVGHIDGGDRKSCERLAGGALGVIFVGVGALIPIALLTAPMLLMFGALGSGSTAIAEEQQRVAGLFLLMLLPQVFLYAIVGCSSAVMNAHRRYALAAMAPAIENLGCIVVLGATALLYSHRTTLGEIPIGELLLLGLGTTAAVALHAGVQWYGAWRVGVALRPTMGWRDHEVRGLIRRAVPALAQAALEAVQLLCVLFVANRLAGGVVAYQVAANFFFLPIALGATPVALSLLPRLSRLHRTGDYPLFRDTVVVGLRFALFIAVPAAVALAVLAPVLATAVSFGRMADEGGAVLVESALFVLALGVVGETVFLVSTYASYSRDDTRSPLRSMMVKTAVCLSVLVVALMVDGPSILVVAGLAVSLAATAAAIHRVAALLRGLPAGTERLGPAVLRTTLAAAVMVAPLWVGVRLLDGVGGHLSALLGALGVCVVGALAYVGTQSLLRAPEASWMLGALRRRGEARVE